MWVFLVICVVRARLVSVSDLSLHTSPAVDYVLLVAETLSAVTRLITDFHVYVC